VICDIERELLEEMKTFPANDRYIKSAQRTWNQLCIRRNSEMILEKIFKDTDTDMLSFLKANIDVYKRTGCIYIPSSLLEQACEENGQSDYKALISNFKKEEELVEKENGWTQYPGGYITKSVSPLDELDGDTGFV